MAGGLIELVTYGSQDLYLTGTPEITFFKVVYRRHTNFSMESVRVNFDDTVGFGLQSCLTIPKIGDLIHKMYLEIILPRIELKRDDTSNDSKLDLDQSIANYEIVQSFMSINRRAYVGAFDIFEADNNSNTESMINAIDSVFNEPGTINKIEDFKTLLSNTLDKPFNYDELSIQSIKEQFTADDLIETLFGALTVGIDKSVKTQNFYFIDFRTKRDILADDTNDNLKFAWVNRIGHSILDELEIRIGGHKMDRQYGDWINIWYELTAKRNMEDIYFEMIGNVSKLTSFDRVVKPSYKITVPMQFWFNRYSGLSLPLVALEYHDVTYHVRFRKLEEVSYIEEGKKVFVSSNNDKLFLDELTNELGINIEASLLIDYIYLDSTERRRFAQASHEYLIDQIQTLEINNVTQPTKQIILNNFVHPSKELIWVSQKKRYTQNIDGYTQTRFDNYSLTDNNLGNPIRYSSMDFHSYTRVQKNSGCYFNYVQPLQHHSTTPSDGINVYSFSLFPEEHQPSCTANFSRLSRVTLTLEFDPILFPEGGVQENLIVRIYTRNTNILRLFSGLGGLAFSY
jgi:hypothetical protein